MGFYGNITNTSNTTFQFDRIYPNRLAMEANANNDGIFIGRYVLVEYEQGAAYPNIYINNGKYYSSPNFEEVTRIKYKTGGRPASDTSNDVFYLGEFGQKQESEKIYFYMCDGYETVEENLYATFKQVTAVNKDDATPYLINHNIDYEEYKNAKGYDSSVWTKVNEEKNGKLVTRYRNIADLNSVVPTFDLETDAPTMTPITPHFDADSTNVYYKLHTQPQWGLRVAAQEDENSDSTTTWQFTTYNPATDETITHEEKNKAAAINFNGPAFDAQVGKANILKHDSGENYITILPTGESGKKYYTHTNKNGEKVYEKAPDIQEVRINLPAIGNMMSDAWDIIHGSLRNDDMREFDADGKNVSSLKGRLNSIDALEDDAIPVKRDADGKLVGNKINGGKTTNTDYTGKDDDAWIETLVNGNEETITIHHTYDLDNKSNYKDIGHLEGKLNSNNDTTNNVNLNDGTNEFKINTPIVDSMGHVVGRNTEVIELPYGYKTIKTNGLIDNTDNDLDSSIGRESIADNTQDTLNIDTKNKWLQIEVTDDKVELAHEIHDIDIKSNGHTNLNKEANAYQEDNLTIYDWNYDNAGHIVAKKQHTYTLPFSYKVIKTLNSEGVGQADIDLGTNYKIMANKTQDEMQFEAANKWIGVMATEEGNVDKIYLGHLTNGNGFGKTYYAKDSTLSNDDVYKQIPNFGDNIKILNVTVDNAGHVTGFNANTITIPDGSYTPANEATPHTDIITSIGFVPSSGAITSTKANTDTLTLYNYSANSGNLDIKATDTINDGLKKVQNHINSLDMSSISTTEFITEITQTDGQVAVKRAKAGTLELGTDSTDKTVLGTDSLNQAINKIEARIKAEEENRKNAIDTLYGNNGEKIAETFDTIKEIADFLEQEDNDKQSGVEKIISDINTNAYNIAQEKLRAENAETALSTNLANEITRATNAENANTNLINQEASRAQNKENEIVNNLNNEISRATEEEGKLNTRIDNLVGNTKVSTQIDNKINTFNSTLGSAAYTESNMYALAGSYDNRVLQSVYDTKIAELEATILALTARVEALEPESETPVEGE